MSTPRYGHAPITMRRVPDSSSLENIGDFCWQVNDAGQRTLVVIIPDTPSNWTRPDKNWTYSRWTIDHKNGCGAQWSWNGNEDRPTLSPSLHAVGTWHGWVRDGQLVEA